MPIVSPPSSRVVEDTSIRDPTRKDEIRQAQASQPLRIVVLPEGPSTMEYTINFPLPVEETGQSPLPPHPRFEPVILIDHN